MTRATRIGDELVSIIYFDEITKLRAIVLDILVRNALKKNISDQTVKTFNAVAAIARKTSELAPPFAVTFMPTMVD